MIDPNTLVDAINKYGFPIITSCATGYMLYYVWRWVTTVVKPLLRSTEETTVALIDRIRILDTELARLHQKLLTVNEITPKHNNDHK